MDDYEPSWSTVHVPGVQCEKPCCCNCRFHLADFRHCTTVNRRPGEGCVCSQPRGWICAMPAMIPNYGGRAHSGWREHGMCEMHTRPEA